MADPEISFPECIELNGIDYFLLQLDTIMFKSSRYRNVCSLLLELESVLDISQLEQYLLQQPGYLWVSRLRLKRSGFFSLPLWKVDPDSAVPVIEKRQLSGSEQIPATWLSGDINLQHQTPFKIIYIQRAGKGGSLIFTWHHALMDAHGGELFIKNLGLQGALRELNWLAKPEQNLPFWERAKIAHQLKKFVYQISELPFFVCTNQQSQTCQLKYQTITFKAEQLQTIQAHAQQCGAGFMVSAFYLAVISCTLAQVQADESNQQGDVLVPVPQDKRLRGAQGPIIGNQVTFLFYRIPRAALSNIETCTAEIVQQMTQLMRSGSPVHYLIMMNFLRRIPGPVYRFLLKQPTGGLMGSFFYSDTGASLSEIEQFFDCKVIQATHYPPNVYPPGLTFVFSRYKGSLQITIGYMEHVLSAQQLQKLIAGMKTALLGQVAPIAS